MAEEHRLQAPEGHRLCANNCGFFGSPATMNLCSKCYGDLCQQKASIKSTVETSSLSPSSSSSNSLSPSSEIAVGSPSPPPPPPLLKLPEASGEARRAQDGVAAAVPQPNRCAACRKRLGLTGFKCRCGTTFCGAHRYPEKHACSFDFKKVGRDEIARANPVVKAEKLEKI